MIAAIELKVNNWVMLGGLYYQLTLDNYQKLIVFETFDRIEPIPLTLEIEKCGFKLIRKADYVHTDFDLWQNGDFELEDMIYRGPHEVELKYIHQLQNLYYSIMGIELEINL